MGNVGIVIAPPKMISSAQTVANTGRRMKKSTKHHLIFNELSPTVFRRSIHDAKSPARMPFTSHKSPVTSHESRLLHLLHHRHAVLQKLQSRNNNEVPWFDAIEHHIIIAQRVAHLQKLLPRHR